MSDDNPTFPNIPPDSDGPPSYKMDYGPVTDGMQMDPAVAIARSDRAKWMSQLVMGGSVIAVFFIAVIGGMRGISQSQNTTVGASYDLKRSLEGTVESVDAGGNSFTVRYIGTQDEKIASAGYFIWTVKLAPGDFFTKTGSRFCYKNRDFSSAPHAAKKTECSSVVAVGKPIIVEYAVLLADKGEIIAKAVIGVE